MKVALAKEIDPSEQRVASFARYGEEVQGFGRRGRRAPCHQGKYASFESRVGGLPGQVRAQARRSEHLTRVG